MFQRSVLIFPKFSNIHIINNLRALYDPLADLVLPHITLVFPFKSDFELKELVSHMTSVLEGVKPFQLKMEGVEPSQSGGNYLFLKVINGVDAINSIHDKLYGNILDEYYRKDLPYIPHLTVGLVDGQSDYDKAIQATIGIDDIFETIVDRLYLERIGPDGESIIEFEYNFTS